MNILMTGGTGLIGQAFIHHYSQYQFTVLTRSIECARKQLPASVSYLESLASLKNLDDFDVVINLAGEPIIDKRWSKKQKSRICDSRWQITRQLVDLFSSSSTQPGVFLSGSAIGIYGDRGDDVITETSGLKQNDFPTMLCQQWEAIAREAEAFTRVVTLRTGIVLDAQGGALKKMLLPFKYYLGGKIGSGQQYMSWIHCADVVKAMHYVITQTTASGAVNLVAPAPVRNIEFTRSLAAALGTKAVLPVPEPLLKLMLGESACLLLDSQNIYPEQLINSNFEFSFPNLNGTLADLLTH